MGNGSRRAVRIIVAGRVQGVWFRGWTQKTATALKVAGWVRNRLDGSVEAVFVGQPDAVDAMVEACRRGPPAARVDRLQIERVDDPGLDRFEAWPTL